jgi:4-alpha-glucanotransferase
VATMAITPVQDLLGLPKEARMNTPGTVAGNWTWRCEPGSLTEHKSHQLRELTQLYNRIVSDGR